MILIEDILHSRDKLLELTDLAKKDSFSNFNKFEERIPDYLNYHVAKYNDEVIAMSGMFKSKQWDPRFVRIADRTYYFEIARSSTLSYMNEKQFKATASTYFLPLHVKIALEKKLIPFFSISGIKRRGAMTKVIKRWNDNDENENKFILLPGMYYTCNHHISSNTNEACWQNIAMLDIDGRKNFDLPNRHIE